MNQNRPGLSSFTDRHGRRRWRYRRKGKTVSLTGQPGEPAFEAAYLAAIEGRAPVPAEIVKHPHAATPRSLGAAWRLVLGSIEWKALKPASQTNNTRLAEEFLSSRIDPERPILWRDAPIADLRRRHIKDILAAHSDTPHKATHLLVTLRKMIIAAMDQEWIAADPSYKVHWRAQYKGWKAWKFEAMRQFEARWPIGSTPRLAYALALWLGNRRSDVVSLRWDQRGEHSIIVRGEFRLVDCFEVTQVKTGKRIVLPVSPMLRDILAATPRRCDTVLSTAYGRPFSAKSLTGRMADWSRAAGLPPGHTLHGLRKALGKMLAEGGASTRQLMEVLGHDDIEHAELYSREAEAASLAVEGMERVVNLHEKRQRLAKHAGT